MSGLQNVVSFNKSLRTPDVCSPLMRTSQEAVIKCIKAVEMFFFWLTAFYCLTSEPSLYSYPGLWKCKWTLRGNVYLRQVTTHFTERKSCSVGSFCTSEPALLTLVLQNTLTKIEDLVFHVLHYYQNSNESTRWLIYLNNVHPLKNHLGNSEVDLLNSSEAYSSKLPAATIQNSSRALEMCW